MSALLFLLLAGPCVAVRQSTHDQPSVGEYEIQGQTIRLTQVGEIGDGESILWAKPEKPGMPKAIAENLMETEAEVRGCPSDSEVWEETGKVLGRGAMGKVVEVESKGIGFIFKDGTGQRRFRGVFSKEVKSASYIAPEMKGDLHNWQRHQDSWTKRKCGDAVVRQLIDGMLCLHKAGYIHGDLKGDNVFYKDVDHNGCPTGVVLADFGLSQQVGSPMHKYSGRYYEGSCHLPGSVFEGIQDTLRIGQGKHYATASPDIDKCSLSYLAYSYFKITITHGEPARGSCGPMGRRKAEK